MLTFSRLIACAALTASVSSAFAHNHITVDTASGTPGDQIVIRAGYLPAESSYSIADGRLLLDGTLAVYEVPDPLTQSGPLNGWYAGDDILLTSDFYYSTGRLAGGNFRWEIVAVTPIAGDPTVLDWGDFKASGFVPSASSSATDRLGRSFDTKIAGHNHAQGYAFASAGTFDVTLIAWDSNGIYLDSDPVTIRFHAGVNCPADFDGSRFVDTDDFDAFVFAFIAGDLSADFDGSGFVDTDDFDAFVRAFEAGC